MLQSIRDIRHAIIALVIVIFRLAGRGQLLKQHATATIQTAATTATTAAITSILVITMVVAVVADIARGACQPLLGIRFNIVHVICRLLRVVRACH